CCDRQVGIIGYIRNTVQVGDLVVQEIAQKKNEDRRTRPNCSRLRTDKGLRMGTEVSSGGIERAKSHCYLRAVGPAEMKPNPAPPRAHADGMGSCEAPPAVAPYRARLRRRT